MLCLMTRILLGIIQLPSLLLECFSHMINGLLGNFNISMHTVMKFAYVVWWFHEFPPRIPAVLGRCSDLDVLKKCLSSFILCSIIAGFPVRVINIGVHGVLKINPNLVPFLDSFVLRFVFSFETFHCMMVHAKVDALGDVFFPGWVVVGVVVNNLET